jgi:hypothetical protein
MQIMERHPSRSIVDATNPNVEEVVMSLGTLLLIVLLLMLIGVIPTWPHSRSWGYRPSGLLGVVLIIVVILLLTGRL